MNFPKISELKTQDIAIAGFGMEGKTSLEWLEKNGCGNITIYDQKEVENSKYETKQVATFLEIDPKHDLIFKSASIRPDAFTPSATVTTATQLFFHLCPAPIIGVTGTKGKGTTTSLIHEILTAAGITSHLLGNIGIPALGKVDQITATDIVCFELSSFQLWDMNVSPQTAVVLMMAEDHMDVHTSMEEYVDAKANITKYQTKSDTLIYHPSNEYSQTIANHSHAIKLQYMKSGAAQVTEKNVVLDGQEICAIDEVALIGKHNLENITAAITAAWRYTQDVAAHRSAVTTFAGLPHRLEFVTERDGVSYYNDSQSTGPQSTIAGLRSFPGKPRTLIFGGSDKGIDVSTVFDELTANDTLLLIGSSTTRLEEKCKTIGVLAKVEAIGQETTMQQVVTVAKNLTPQNGVVLLSPAHASFDMFDNYKHRGNLFKEAALRA